MQSSPQPGSLRPSPPTNRQPSFEIGRLADRGMRITATRLDTGVAAAIVVERTQEWWATGRPFDSAVFGVAQDEQRQGLP